MTFTQGNCELCSPRQHNDTTSVDLDDLGLLLLECMEGTAMSSARSAADVRKQRGTNKLFGLPNACQWSSETDLIDFIDDLFCESRSPATKVSHPVRLEFWSLGHD